jgi:SAM-dependent methyltransferase
MTEAGMTEFGGYARYYDLLNRDKDYPGEIRFIDGLIRRHAPGARSVLELGCGTGVHGVLLAETGYDLVGLDLSAEMIAVARRRAAALPPDVAKRLRFLQADAREFQLDGQFDVILALFHVMSYQLGNADLSAVFSRLKTHLKPGGVVLFDCWYGPAVLTDRPTVRVRRAADAETDVIRTAEPTLHANDNIVAVSYRLSATDRHSGRVEEFTEVHRMRYLFRPELELLAGLHGLRIVASGAWMTEQPMDSSTWYVYFALKHAG